MVWSLARTHELNTYTSKQVSDYIIIIGQYLESFKKYNYVLG